MVKGYDIILYGAFDRHNYGDLLFPLVMKRVIEQELPQKKVLIAGLINSNLSKSYKLIAVHPL